MDRDSAKNYKVTPLTAQLMATLNSKRETLAQEETSQDASSCFSHEERERDELSQLLDSIEPDEADDHTEVMLQCLEKDHLLSSPECPGTLILRSTGVLYYHFKLCPPVPSYIEQLKWEPGQSEEREENMLEILDFGRVTLNSFLPSLKNFLTLAAKVNDLKMNENQWWYEIFCRLHPMERSLVWGEMTYILLDLGYIDQVSAEFIISWKKCLSDESVQLAAATVETARKFPLSLKQIVRKRIRNAMREGHVLKDCYTLPLPRSLQDYISLRCLNAPIRKWIMGKEQPSSIGHDHYDAKEEVFNRYKICV